MRTFWIQVELELEDGKRLDGPHLHGGRVNLDEFGVLPGLNAIRQGIVVPVSRGNGDTDVPSGGYLLDKPCAKPCASSHKSRWRDEVGSGDTTAFASLSAAFPGPLRSRCVATARSALPFKQR